MIKFNLAFRWSVIEAQFLEHEKCEDSKILKSSRCKARGSSESGDKFNLNAHCEGYTSQSIWSPPEPESQFFLISFKRGKGGSYNYNPCSNFQLKNALKKNAIKCLKWRLWNISIVSSVRSSYSHPCLLLTQHQHPTFSDHTGPQHWTCAFWATTAI